MGDWESKDRRWAELMDRKALGEPLTGEELAFCEHAAAEDPAYRREVELLDELATLDVPPSPDSRALVDAALARLAAESVAAEHDELSRLRKPARIAKLVWISGAAAVAAVALALLLFSGQRSDRKLATVPSPEPRVELVYVAGEVLVDGKPVVFGSTLLAEGSEISVGRGSACIAMDPDIDVCASDDTRLRLARMHSPWRRIDLLEGKVGVQLSPQPEGWRMSIVADDVWATAIGTAFTVVRDDAVGVRTTVLHGKVRVGKDGGSEQIVSEHQRAEVQGAHAKLAPTSRSDESPEWALLSPSKLWSNPVSATLELRGVPPGAEVLLDHQLIGVAPLSSLIPAGMHKLAVRIDGRVVATREFVSEVGQLTAISFEGQQFGAHAATPAVPAPLRPARAPKAVLELEPQPDAMQATEAAPVPAVADLLADARRLMRAGHFGDAVARYQALRAAYPHSAEAHTVLVPLAQVQLDRLGRGEEALANLELYLRAGRGSLTEEARLVRIRALRDLGRRAEETDAIVEFVREHPRSFKAAALQQRLDEVQAHP